MDSPSPVGTGRSAPSSGRGGRGRRQGGERRGRNSGKSSSNRGRGGDDTSRNGNYPAATLPRKPGGGRNDRELCHSSAGDDGALDRDDGGGKGSDGAVAHVRIEDKIGMMSDQDVLIAFGPHVRSGDAEAKRIHQEYLSNTRQHDFIRNARKYLVGLESKPTSEISKEINPKIEPYEPNAEEKIGSFTNHSIQDVVSHQKAAVSSPYFPHPPGFQAPFQYAVTQDRMVASPTGLESEPAGVESFQLQHPGAPHSSSCKPGPPPGIPPLMRPPTALGPESSPPKCSTSSILPARTPPLPVPASKAADLLLSTSSARPLKPRRIQTRCEEQPGRLFANDLPAEAFSDKPDKVIIARPREELTARWVLPLKYLRTRALQRFAEQKTADGAPPQNLTVRDALKDLAVGLFRRGADCGSQVAIISKEILASKDENVRQGGRSTEDYFFNVDQRSDSIFGTVPFYAPRTPGNVVFRLYFEEEPHVTLATGPCIRVVPADGDIDSVLRFILSNFKSKITNGVSSMNSLAAVIHLFSPRQHERYFDGADRIAWGCFCESQKALKSAHAAYIKKKTELEEKLKENLEAERLKEELPDLTSLGIYDEDLSDPDTNGTLMNEERRKHPSVEAKKAKLSTELYSNERKWREIQVVYASLLKAAVSNDASHVLLKRDLVFKLQLEYELWCPFTESFAPYPPGIQRHTLLKASIEDCRESRFKMQENSLGFVPQSRRILSVAKGQFRANHRKVFKELTTAMNELYISEYAVGEKVWKRREKIRAYIEHLVSTSNNFPAGTKVAVFGSSANGFGSPSSDIDLCLQVPPSDTFTKENGVDAMTNLATKFIEAGLTDVDTVRLTARIPIVKFNVPYNEDGEEFLVECDLSLQNPLACLNTSLLHAYSKISQITCVLAAIIKRWAKNRNINNPSQHTLSSYGYVIMLIHFLTSCDFNKNGFVLDNASEPSPILPNLQLVDPSWAQNPSSGSYREISEKPKNKDTIIQHPTEPNYYVNSHFYSSELGGLQKFCSENHNDFSSLGALLASFFHYFAYDFDYKKHVISLNRMHSSPHLEREIKAEEDGWSLFRQGLAIEDPFEQFYDVAHVVKASNFSHMLREFSLAYTKIFDAACADGEPPTGRQIIDMICEPVSDNQKISES